MKTVLLVVSLLTLGGCSATPPTGYIQPVAVVVKEGDHSVVSMGIPWGDFVIAAAHAGLDVVDHVNTTTIYTKDGPRSVVGPPVFSDESDWCLLRPSKPVDQATLALRWNPWLRMYIVLTPLDGSPTHLVRCRPGEWPTGYGSPRDEPPSSEPATQPSQPTAPERKPIGGVYIPVVTEEQIKPGNSGSPVVFYNPWTGRFSVCGLVRGADDRYPEVAAIVPFWDGVGAELMEKSQKAEQEAKMLLITHPGGEEGGDPAP